MENGNVGIRINRLTKDESVGTGEMFVFCLDPDTNELFDGLTDRPIRLLPSSEKQYEIESEDITYNITMAKEDDSNRDQCCGSDRER